MGVLLEKVPWNSFEHRNRVFETVMQGCSREERPCQSSRWAPLALLAVLVPSLARAVHGVSQEPLSTRSTRQLQRRRILYWKKRLDQIGKELNNGTDFIWSAYHFLSKEVLEQTSEGLVIFLHLRELLQSYCIGMFTRSAKQTRIWGKVKHRFWGRHKT